MKSPLRTRDLLIGLIPIVAWLSLVEILESNWRDADPLHDTARGLGSQLVYRFLPVPVLLAAVVLLFGRGVLMRFGQRRTLTYAGIVFMFILLGSALILRIESSHGKAAAYLRQMFADTAGAVVYVEGFSEPVALRSPVLQRLLPQTEFFRAVLRTNQFEYPELETLVAVTNTGKQEITTHCLSPMWADIPPNFPALFSGIRSESLEDREQLAREAANLFASVTYKGRVGAVHAERSTITVELWTGTFLWRTVVLNFDASGVLQHLELRAPRRCD